MIPIANIYYLLSYALGHTQLLSVTELASVEGGKPEDLLGLLLSKVVDRLLKHGLDRGYVVLMEDLRGVRGRIHVSQTVIRGLRRSGRVACEFDEMRHDILPNRIVAKTFRSLLAIPTLSGRTRDAITVTLSRFPRVSDVILAPKLFRDVVIHRNNRHYGLAVDLCRLVFENLIADSGSDGGNRFKDFRRDEAQMGRLFEDFVREFLRAEQNAFSVSSPHIRWAITDPTVDSPELLPLMKTDIVIENAQLVRIIDTKFYRDPLTHRDERVDKLHSSNLYQIFSYVMNHAHHETRRPVEGMLLYAAGGEIHFDSRVLGHRIAVRTIDLSQRWDSIRQDLLSKVGAFEPVAV